LLALPYLVVLESSDNSSGELLWALCEIDSQNLS